MTSAVVTVRSVKKLKMIAQQTDAIVVTGHDLEGWKQFKKAPDFYA